MSTMDQTLKIIQLEQDIIHTQRVMAQLRAYLAGALCTVCGEPLGDDEELTQDDESHTMHSHCLKEEPDET